MKISSKTIFINFERTVKILDNTVEVDVVLQVVLFTDKETGEWEFDKELEMIDYSEIRAFGKNMTKYEEISTFRDSMFAMGIKIDSEVNKSVDLSLDIDAKGLLKLIGLKKC